MKKNSLLRKDDSIIRVLDSQDNKILIIDCIKMTMPKWEDKSIVNGYMDCTEQELQEITNNILCDMDTLDAISKRFIHEHFTLIAGILPFIADEKQRCNVISKIAADRNVSKQTIRKHLCSYLVYQNMSALMPKQKPQEKELSQDEKNMRWALNKFFYTRNKNSLNTAYTMMLKEKYCDVCGVLLPEYPTFYQFRYFYRKHKSMQTYYISRDGLKSYQRNNRP